MSQKEKIKQILLREGKIDNFSTIHKRLSIRLGARIWDIRHQDGWQIDKMMAGKNKNNCVYILKKANN